MVYARTVRVGEGFVSLEVVGVNILRLSKPDRDLLDRLLGLVEDYEARLSTPVSDTQEER